MRSLQTRLNPTLMSKCAELGSEPMKRIKNEYTTIKLEAVVETENISRDHIVPLMDARSSWTQRMNASTTTDLLPFQIYDFKTTICYLKPYGSKGIALR